MLGDGQTLPQLSGRPFITDGGIETDLIFHAGWELPHFAAIVLLEDPHGIKALQQYYRRYASLAQAHEIGLILDTPTWRGSPDWGSRLGYSLEQLAALNHAGVELVRQIGKGFIAVEDLVVSGCVGPRDDGFSAESQMDAAAAEDYHTFQIDALTDAGADMITALTLTYADEAVGVVRAAATRGIPAVISFTGEIDGRLPSRQRLREAIEQVDEQTAGAPAYFMINCAHPIHFAGALAEGGSGVERIRGLRANASTKSHAELDEAEELDAGDPLALAEHYRELAGRNPKLTILGGCCGTDHRHIGAICSIHSR